MEKKHVTINDADEGKQYEVEEVGPSEEDAPAASEEKPAETTEEKPADAPISVFMLRRTPGSFLFLYATVVRSCIY